MTVSSNTIAAMASERHFDIEFKALVRITLATCSLKDEQSKYESDQTKNLIEIVFLK